MQVHELFGVCQGRLTQVDSLDDQVGTSKGHPMSKLEFDSASKKQELQSVYVKFDLSQVARRLQHTTCQKQGAMHWRLLALLTLTMLMLLHTRDQELKL